MNGVKMRYGWTLAAALMLACGPADDAGEADATATPEPAAERADVPAADRLSDWSVVLDNDGADMAGFGMVVDEGSFTVETGPAGIAWRPVDIVPEGDFQVSATFLEMAAPANHREAYGLIVGGRQLEHPDQSYTYFLVRGDGSYLIKQRDGEGTSEVVGWTSSDAVMAVESEGERSPNTLAIRVEGEEVHFDVNGTVVHTMPAADADPWGFAGIRVNHNLNVQVTDWSLEGDSVGMEGLEDDGG